MEKDKKKIRILVTDDTVTYRIILTNILRTFEDVEIAGTAHNGKDALEKIPTCFPDVITMDVEMPVMDGLTALRKIKERYPWIEIIMVSGTTQKNADIVLKALEEGAFDFIIKPTTTSSEQAKKELTKTLRNHISNLKAKKATQEQTVRHPRPIYLKLSRQPSIYPVKVDLVAIGVSTGGPKALARIMPSLSPNLPPILIVQHMPPLFTRSLASNLNKLCPLTVKEAEDGEPILPGTAYIAPGGRHMVIRTSNASFKVGLNDLPPENSCRPSVDVLLRSIAAQFHRKALSVILTGMGSDGLSGMKALKRKGVFCIAQDETSCAVYGMPRAIVENGLADEILPLEKIAQRINQLAGIK